MPTVGADLGSASRYPRADHCLDYDADDLPISGGPVAHDRPVLGVLYAAAPSGRRRRSRRYSTSSCIARTRRIAGCGGAARPAGQRPSFSFNRSNNSRSRAPVIGPDMALSFSLVEVSRFDERVVPDEGRGPSAGAMLDRSAAIHPGPFPAALRCLGPRRHLGAVRRARVLDGRGDHGCPRRCRSAAARPRPVPLRASLSMS